MIKFIIGKEVGDLKMFVDRVQVPVPEMLISKLTFSIESPDKRKLTIESDWFEIEAVVDGKLVPVGGNVAQGEVDAWVARKLSSQPDDKTAGFPERVPPAKEWVRYELRPSGGGCGWTLSSKGQVFALTGNLFAENPYLEVLRSAIRYLRQMFKCDGQRSSLRIYDSLGGLSEIYNVDSADAFEAFFD